ncbi:hypothetical protein FS842_005427 [Serendipita sp. 407]|nr:hypothetical protein FS842_005427 [Serendipita sp. 407]
MVFTPRVDILTVGIILSILVGIVFAIITVSGKVQEAVKSTQASLNDKGVNLSASGMSVKTDKNISREDYLDATQRGIINTMKAASFGAPDNQRSLADIDKHRRSAPSSPDALPTAKKRSIFGKKQQK